VFVQNFAPKERVLLIESVFYTHTHKQNKKREVWWFFFAPSFSLFWDTLLRKRLRKMDEIEDWQIRMG